MFLWDSDHSRMSTYIHTFLSSTWHSSSLYQESTLCSTLCWVETGCVIITCKWMLCFGSTEGKRHFWTFTESLGNPWSPSSCYFICSWRVEADKVSKTVDLDLIFLQLLLILEFQIITCKLNEGNNPAKWGDNLIAVKSNVWNKDSIIRLVFLYRLVKPLVFGFVAHLLYGSFNKLTIRKLAKWNLTQLMYLTRTSMFLASYCVSNQLFYYCPVLAQI